MFDWEEYCEETPTMVPFKVYCACFYNVVKDKANKLIQLLGKL